MQKASPSQLDPENDQPKNCTRKIDKHRNRNRLQTL